MKPEQLKYYLALQKVPMIGPSLAKNLIAWCGSAEAVFNEKLRSLEKVPNIGNRIGKNILAFKDFERIEKELEFIEKHHISTSVFFEESYPERLKDIDDAPIVLFSKGNFNLNHPRVLGIVGTRNASQYGKDVCQLIVHQLKEYQPYIVSGLAYGIDTVAHKSALETGLPTVGILGHGIDMIYPAENRETAIKMLENGGLITEYWSETKPIASNFPDRNRIVAGLIDGLLIVESAKKGGSLITAEITYSFNRDVFAIPGRINDTWSAGCNNFIRRQKAIMVTSGHDIAYHMGWEKMNGQKTEASSKSFSGLKGIDKKIVSFLHENTQMHIDDLANLLSLPSSEVSIKLLELEFKDLVQSLPGNQYRLKP